MSAMAETKGRRSRRRFTDEFKQQAVRLVLDEGKGVTAVARELDLVPSALGQWTTTGGRAVKRPVSHTASMR